MSEMLYPIGIQDFKTLRKDGYVYVDKTHHVYELTHTGRYYFLGRPRRFGKSLLISTMEAYFSGEKELFKGLEIERLEKDWVVYPVLHLDLNARKYDCMEALRMELDKHLEKWETEYGDKYKDKAVEERFLQVIELAYKKTGRRVVILVDEYDKPLLQSIGNEPLQDEFRKTLKAFYSVLKTQDRYIKFAFLTGVTRFGKVSIFSDLNNLNDISMDRRYVDICGITEKEMHVYFESSIRELAEANGISYEEACVALKEQYNGYHFRQECAGIYNPFSLLNALSKKEFGSYWFETGTPTFLVELLKQSDYGLERLGYEEQDVSVLSSIDSMRENPIPVLYQSGYLTIKGYDKVFNTYLLGFPNKEVEVGFLKYLLPFYLPVSNNDAIFAINNFVKEVNQGNPEAFMRRLKALFANTSYKISGEMEKYYQNALFLIFTLMGIYTEVERTTSRGRMDVVIKTKGYLYVIECKLDKPAAEAMTQIEENGYATPFLTDPRKLYKIGVSFSSKTRGIEDYIISE